MVILRFRKRRRLRRKEVAALHGRLESTFGVSPFTAEASVDRAEGPAYDVLYEGGDIVALLFDAVPAPSVRGLLRSRPTKRYVTVDAGAVPFVYNGADVMAPGIVEADPKIEPGDFVWVRDEANGVPLAVGRALLPGPAMVAGRKGKAVESVHHVGDRLWKLAEE
ncbi:MAG: PUA domain-containing protein [Thermoplasmata archaeon]